MLLYLTYYLLPFQTLYLVFTITIIISNISTLNLQQVLESSLIRLELTYSH